MSARRTGAGREWWRTYFDAEWLRLHEPLFDERQSRREVSAIRELLGVPHGARILDAPCGWGRHTELFAEAGLDPYGADLSRALLERAGRPDARQGRYVAADLRRLPFADASFDATCNVFTSLGLFASDEEDVQVLREARRVLRPGGRLLLESIHRDDVVANYAERDAFTLPDGTEVTFRRRFDPVTGLSHEHMRWRRGDERGTKTHVLRLRTATEIAGLLEQAGFVEPVWYGDWNGSSFTRRSPRVIVVASRTA